jgi:hypothetical protein
LACNLHRHFFLLLLVGTIRSARSIGFHLRSFTSFLDFFLGFGNFFVSKFRFDISFRFRPLFFFLRLSSLLLSIHHPTLSPSIGSSLLVASPDVAEFERLRSRLNESQTQTRYLQSMVNIRDQELDRARKVSCHVSLFFVSLFSFFLVFSNSVGNETKQHRNQKAPGRPNKNVIFFNYQLSPRCK